MQCTCALHVVHISIFCAPANTLKWSLNIRSITLPCNTSPFIRQTIRPFQYTGLLLYKEVVKILQLHTPDKISLRFSF